MPPLGANCPTAAELDTTAAASVVSYRRQSSAADQHSAPTAAASVVSHRRQPSASDQHSAPTAAASVVSNRCQPDVDRRRPQQYALNTSSLSDSVPSQIIHAISSSIVQTYTMFWNGAVREMLRKAQQTGAGLWGINSFQVAKKSSLGRAVNAHHRMGHGRLIELRSLYTEYISAAAAMTVPDFTRLKRSAEHGYTLANLKVHHFVRKLLNREKGRESPTRLASCMRRLMRQENDKSLDLVPWVTPLIYTIWVMSRGQIDEFQFE